MDANVDEDAIRRAEFDALTKDRVNNARYFSMASSEARLTSRELSDTDSNSDDDVEGQDTAASAGTLDDHTDAKTPNVTPQRPRGLPSEQEATHADNPSTDESGTDGSWDSSDEDLDSLLNQLDSADSPPPAGALRKMDFRPERSQRHPPPVGRLCVVTWNIERGFKLEGILQELRKLDPGEWQLYNEHG